MMFNPLKRDFLGKPDYKLPIKTVDLKNNRIINHSMEIEKKEVKKLKKAKKYKTKIDIKKIVATKKDVIVKEPEIIIDEIKLNKPEEDLIVKEPEIISNEDKFEGIKIKKNINENKSLKKKEKNTILFKEKEMNLDDFIKAPKTVEQDEYQEEEL